MEEARTFMRTLHEKVELVLQQPIDVKEPAPKRRRLSFTLTQRAEKRRGNPYKDAARLTAWRAVRVSVHSDYLCCGE